MPQDINSFADDDAPAIDPDKVTTTFELGGKTYNAVMPKQTPWLDAYKLWGDMEAAAAAQKRLAEPSATALSVHERARLQALVDNNPHIWRIIEVFVTGWTDEQTGRPHGGFFLWCVSPEDYQEIIALPHDRHSRVDWTDIWQVALDLLLYFEEPMVKLAEESGLNVTRVESRSVRRRASTTKAAPAKPAKRAKAANPKPVAKR